MKPAKKKPNINCKKDNKNGSVAAVPLIQSFFKTAPKTFVVDKTNVSAKPNPSDGDRQFYVDLLKNKLESAPDHAILTNDGEDVLALEQTDSSRNCGTQASLNSDFHTSKNSDECAGCVQKTAERDEWERKYKQEFEKRQQLKKVYMNLNVEFSELYMKHQSLQKAKGANLDIGHGTLCAATVAMPTVATSSTETTCATKGGDDVFTEAQVKFLQLLPLDKKSDCTFILQCLKYAYKSDPTVLASKTLKGTAERIEISSEGIQIHHEGKSPMTPPKVENIKNLFMERISKCDDHSADYMSRMKESYVNKLFAAGIGNMSKKTVPSNKNKNL